MQTAAQTEIKPAPAATLRDLARLCKVRRLFDRYFLVRTDNRHEYKVSCHLERGEFVARCNCPVRTYRKQQCRHELATIMHERSRVASAQGF